MWLLISVLWLLELVHGAGCSPFFVCDGEHLQFCKGCSPNSMNHG